MSGHQADCVPVQLELWAEDGEHCLPGGGSYPCQPQLYSLLWVSFLYTEAEVELLTLV